MSEAVPDAPPPGAATSLRSIASIATLEASRYLQQLCKHFAHKLSVSFDERRGHIAFSIGTCELEAENGALRIGIAAANGADLAQLADVVQRHLVRFAFREDLAIRWTTD